MLYVVFCVLIHCLYLSLDALQILHNLVVDMTVELVEAKAESRYHPQYTGDGGEGVAHDGKDVSVLFGTCHVSGRVESQGEHRRAESHAHLVGERHEGILESVVAYAGLPFAVLHTVGDDSIDGCVEAREEEPCYGRADIEFYGRGVGAEEIEQTHKHSAEQGEDSGGISFVACLAEHPREAGGSGY